MNTSTVFLALVAAVLLILPACGSDRAVSTQIPTAEPISLAVEDAGEPWGEKFFTGLSGRESVEGGMLFDFEETVTVGFQMRKTLVPLSIAFVSETGIIVDIKNMAPLSEDSYVSARPYRYAIEVNQGYFAKHGIGVGDLVEVERADSEDFAIVVFHRS
ncbi:MAG: DUF192 domain-containing protein [Chloroflexi bacterium]|nr:DUF192 domain-containing protein [Chloroflexota bacterium]